jgi:hypothetical protein
MSGQGTGPTTGEELNADLKRLFRQAHDNGVDVRGGWECRNGRGAPDWDLVVTEVEKREGSE